MVVRSACGVACVILVIATACRGSKEPEAKELESTVVAAERPDPGFVAWTPAMYTELAEKVAGDCSGASAPRLGSTEFDQLIDIRNFETFDESDAPAMERMPPMMDLTDGMKSLMMAYGGCESIVEFVAMSMLLIEGYVRVLPPMDEFLAGFSPEDPTYDNRVAGRTRTLGGIHGMIRWTIGTLAEPRYDLALLDRIATRLGTAFAGAFRWLPPETVSVELGRLRDVVSQTSDPTRKASLQLILDAAE